MIPGFALTEAWHTRRQGEENFTTGNLHLGCASLWCCSPGSALSTFCSAGGSQLLFGWRSKLWGFRSGTVLAVHVGLGDGVGSQARPPRGVCARRRSSSAVWKRRRMVTGGSSHRGASRAPWEAALRGWRSCCSVGSPRGCGRGSGVAPLSRCLFLPGSGSAAPAGSVLPRPCPSLGGPAASEK